MKRMMNMFTVVLLLLFSGCREPDRSHSSHKPSRSHRLIVIDAGHGGHDCGAQCGGRQEKDVVLQIIQKLYKEFKREGYRIYMTREDDRFLTLGQRTRIADKKDADVFISIHANAIANRSRFEMVEGIETYFLQKTRDERSQRIAQRENDAVLKGADDLSRNVIVDSVLAGPKVIESHKLAIDVQNHIMHSIHRKYKDVRNGGAKPAPFYVLVGASRPSILVEVGYITNSKERKRLFDPDYQKSIVKGIVQGVNRYLDNREKELEI